MSRYGHARVVLGGLVLAVLSYALFLRISLDWTYASMFPTMILLGLAFALAYGPLTIAATDGIAADEQGLAGGLFNTAFQFGAALGLSAVSAISVYSLADPSPAGRLEALQTALLVPVAATALAVLVIATGLRRPGLQPQQAG